MRRLVTPDEGLRTNDGSRVTSAIDTPRRSNRTKGACSIARRCRIANELWQLDALTACGRWVLLAEYAFPS